jgi:hypothetical protein
MKLFFTTLGVLFYSISTFAQITPQASPVASFTQKIGLTDLTVTYARPSKNGRAIFGALLPYGEVWRTGANENSTLTTSDALIFGKDTLKAGKYAIFTVPNKETWDLIFYKKTDNWGTPEEWKESDVALRVTSKPVLLNDIVESLTLQFENLTTTGASLTLAWDNVKVAFPFQVPTDAKVMANIQKTMAGPDANALNGSALYYLTTKRDLNQALAWSTKACELKPEAFWMLRTKSLIQAELGKKKEAIETAKAGLELAKKAGNSAYTTMFEESLKSWSK